MKCLNIWNGYGPYAYACASLGKYLCYQRLDLTLRLMCVRRGGGGINDTQFELLSWSCKHIVIRSQTSSAQLLQRDVRGSETGHPTTQSSSQKQQSDTGHVHTALI